MKKKFLGVLIGITLLFLFPKIASAAPCKDIPQGVRCNLTVCNVGGVYRCCNSPADCSQENGNVTPLVTTVPLPASANVHGNCGDTGIDTAIGCIQFGDQNVFLGAILRWAVGIGGGIAFLLIIYAGFMIMTAAGNPERLKAGQELLTSAISGLILLILSVFVLKFIGIDILGLGPLGFSTQ